MHYRGLGEAPAGVGQPVVARSAVQVHMYMRVYLSSIEGPSSLLFSSLASIASHRISLCPLLASSPPFRQPFSFCVTGTKNDNVYVGLR